MKPTISIVMPVYNAGNYITESIESIRCQTFDDFELIIIDDGSTDNSVEIVKSYHDSCIILLENSHDFIRSLNTGIEVSKGKYIARMDADDIMMPNRLQLQYEFMESQPDVDICGGWMEIVGSGKGIMQQPLSHNEILSIMLMHCPLYHPTVMLRRDSISKLSSYPHIYKQKFIYAEDYKLWTELAMAGLHFANIPEILVKYRLSETQNSSKFTFRMHDGSKHIQSEYLEYVSGKLVENDEKLFGFINRAIELFNESALTFNSLKQVVYDIYKHHLLQQI